VDGQPVARLADWVCEREKVILAGNSFSLDVLNGDSPLAMSVVQWNVKDTVGVAALHQARAYACEQIASVQFHQLQYVGYGKNAITQRGTSPDAWCQSLLQCAYYRMHGHFGPAYESASTRRHLAGRTETGRTCTPELARFVRAFAAVTDVLSLSTERVSELQSLFRAAAVAHTKYMREAVQGYGVDRHLLAMRLLAAENNLSHPFLSDPLVVASGHWKLSTSQLPVRYIYVGFGPVVPDGYGVCYQIHESMLHFSISSWVADKNTDSFKFADQVSRAADQFIQLIRTTSKL
jgi:carnitine O-acetyltransferase